VGDLHRLIAFDLDGTLIDSRRDLADSANELIVELGGSPLPEEAVGGMVGEGAAVLVRRALTAAQVEHPPDALTRFLEIYDRRLLVHTRLYPGVRGPIEKAREGARVAMLTNKPLHHTERILEALGLRPLFDDVIGGDSPYGRKPDPAGLQALMAAAGATAGRTLLVGDSAIDHETARRASVQCCLVAFGFGFESFPKERFAGDESVVRDAGELTAVIERFLRS